MPAPSSSSSPAENSPGATHSVTDSNSEFNDIDLAASPEKSSNVCFPRDVTAQLENGDMVSISSLSVGDCVWVSKTEFSWVFMFTHKMGNVRRSFFKICTSKSHMLRLTTGHYLYVNGKLAAAHTVRVGDTLQLASGRFISVSKVTMKEGYGLYNPQTVHEAIIFNNIRASTYITGVQPRFSHALLTPLRALYNSYSFVTGAFNHGICTFF